MLEVAQQYGFTFDTVQMPLNVMDAHYRSFEKLVLPELVKQNIGVLAMKMHGKRDDPEVENSQRDRMSAIRDEPAGFGGDHRLRKYGKPGTGDQAARTFKPMSERRSQQPSGENRTKLQRRGEYELFKTTSIYDGTDDASRVAG